MREVIKRLTKLLHGDPSIMTPRIVEDAAILCNYFILSRKGTPKYELFEILAKMFGMKSSQLQGRYSLMKDYPLYERASDETLAEVNELCTLLFKKIEEIKKEKAERAKQRQEYKKYLLDNKIIDPKLIDPNTYRRN